MLLACCASAVGGVRGMREGWEGSPGQQLRDAAAQFGNFVFS